MADHYEVLEVSHDATQEEIKRAYRKLARRFHPDANPGDADAEERFKQISSAYETLSDPERRRRYDLFGDERVGAAHFSDFGGISDLFSAFFGGVGGATRRTSSVRGADVVAEVELALEDAATGIERDVKVTTLVECDDCEGTGAAPGTHPSRCRECGGSGELRQVQRSLLGNVMTSTTCPACSGAGQVIASPCSRCGGRGRVRSIETLTVKIPPGVDDGAQLRVSGRGEAGLRGGRSGDLYVVIRVLPHDTFKRVGDDLGVEVSVPMTVAALGGSVSVKTLDGSQEIDITPGTQSGEVVTLSGKGMPRLERSGRGDLVALLKVDIPRDLDGRQADLLRQLAEARGEQVGTKGLFDKFKQAFG